MGLFDINYFSKAIELLPPFKRYIVNVRWVQSLIKPMQFLRDKVLGDYRIGNIYPQWFASTYNTDQRVIYKQVVYESLVDGNTDQPPSPNWGIYLPSFIGVDTRVRFNGQKIVLEYALNSYFFTNFRQPPLVSDIYIGKLAPDVVGFVVGETDGSLVSATDTNGISQWVIGSYNIGDVVKNLGYMFLSKTNGNITAPPSSSWYKSETIGFNTPFQQLNNFTIYIPSAVFYSSTPFVATIEAEVRIFVDKILPAGLRYTVTPY